LWTIFFNAKTCEIYNVGGVQSISISDLAIKVNKLIGGSGRIKILGKSTLNTLNQSYLPLLHKIFKELNVIETVSLEQAIIKTAFWAKNNFHVK
jgi:dTDP-glucose 4,6-dehydratase